MGHPGTGVTAGLDVAAAARTAQARVDLYDKREHVDELVSFCETNLSSTAGIAGIR